MYNAVDLFSGAGGLSYGFEQAGFKIVFANEMDSWAAETYVHNRENAHMVVGDISEIPDSAFEPYNGITDVVMGGPPCQGFSIAASNRRDKNDRRNYLFRQLLRVVDIVMPKVVLIENVRQFETAILPDGIKIIDEISAFFEDKGYYFEHAIINVAEYGVPQERVRFFLIAHRKEIPWKSNFFKALEQSPELTIWDAISDLPDVFPCQYSEGDMVKYDKCPTNEYQRQLRGNKSAVANHIAMRHTKRTIEKFSYIVCGDSAELPDNFKPRKRGNPIEISEKVYDQNHRRINPNKPSPTITASFYSSFIHPFANRNLTVREAARIQGFPDDYEFTGKRTTLSKKLLKAKGITEDIHLDQFNQVGNAVPPIFAKKIAEEIAFRLGGENR